MKFNLNDKALVKKGLFKTFSVEIQTEEGELKYSSLDFDEEFVQEKVECEVKDLFAGVLTPAQVKEVFRIVHYPRMKQKNLLLRNQTEEYAWEKGFAYKYGSQAEADSELEDIFCDLEQTTIDAGADMDFHEAMTGESRL